MATCRQLLEAELRGRLTAAGVAIDLRLGYQPRCSTLETLLVWLDEHQERGDARLPRGWELGLHTWCECEPAGVMTGIPHDPLAWRVNNSGDHLFLDYPDRPYCAIWPPEPQKQPQVHSCGKRLVGRHILQKRQPQFASWRKVAASDPVADIQRAEAMLWGQVPFPEVMTATGKALDRIAAMFGVRRQRRWCEGQWESFSVTRDPYDIYDTSSCYEHRVETDDELRQRILDTPRP